MFFGRIYPRGRPFQPSWRSYAGYSATIALILLAIEFNVLNVLPGNKAGNVLLLVPAFYFVIAAIFLLNDVCIAVWNRLKGVRKSRRRRARG